MMGFLIGLIRYGIITAILIFFVPNLHSASAKQFQCFDVAERGHLNALTINLLFSEIENRAERLNKIANFIKEEDFAGEPVDILLLQEVVSGPLSGTINSSYDLAQLLLDDGMEYNIHHNLVNGVPGVFTVGDAILSRCGIIFTISRSLPFASEQPFNDFKIFLKRKVMMSRIDIQDFGKINVYNTHLCAFCDPATERLEQTEVMLQFIENMENVVQGENPIILGGDFNINLNIPNDITTYDLITEDFLDTYSSVNGCTDCCSESEGEGGCTFAVEGNPFVNKIRQVPEEPKRIDYIFTKDLKIEDSFVIFNNDPDWVSDHSGVLTRIRIP